MTRRSEHQLKLGSQTIPVLIERRARSRHLRMRLSHENALRVSAPLQCPDERIWDFIRQRQAWVEQQLAKTPPPRTLSDWLQAHPRISAKGITMGVQFSRHETGKICRYTFTGESTLAIEYSVDAEEAQLLSLMQALAKKVLLLRLVDLAMPLKLELPRLTVRDQASRWGSCSSRGRVSLNWRLILLDPELQDYVILHELAHLVELNHSANFWALLERYDPDFRAHEAALRAVSAEIIRVGVS